jgi:hypothetical protein
MPASNQPVWTIDLQALAEINGGPAAAGSEQGKGHEEDQATGRGAHRRYSRTLAPDPRPFTRDLPGQERRQIRSLQANKKATARRYGR